MHGLMQVGLELRRDSVVRGSLAHGVEQVRREVP